MADVFISYARSDVAVARLMTAALESDGFSVWWDGRIEANAAWEASIEKELDEARLVLVLWSEQSVVSDNVRAEARRGLSTDRLVQVTLDETAPPLAFGERQHLGLARWDGSKTHQYLAILEALRRVMSGAQLKGTQAPRKRCLSNTIDENDARYLALSPLDRVSLSLSPIDLRRSQRFRHNLEAARQMVRASGLNGGWHRWFAARLAIASLGRQCRADEAWHRRYVRQAYTNNLVRELQLAYVVDVFERREDDLCSLRRELGRCPNAHPTHPNL